MIKSTVGPWGTPEERPQFNEQGHRILYDNRGYRVCTVHDKPAWGETKGWAFEPQTLTDDEFQRLLRACGSENSAGAKRSRAFYTLMRGACLRVSEALSLFPADLHRYRKTIDVRDGKGRKARTVAMAEACWEILDTWLQARLECGCTHNHPVLCQYVTYGGHRSKSKVGDPFPRSQLSRYLAVHAERAGISKYKRVHYHMLRHTGAYKLASHPNVSLLTVRDQLGHARLQTTERYINHHFPEHQVRAVEEVDWE